jgi:hypothetical protein
VTVDRGRMISDKTVIADKFLRFNDEFDRHYLIIYSGKWFLIETYTEVLDHLSLLCERYWMVFVSGHFSRINEATLIIVTQVYPLFSVQ